MRSQIRLFTCGLLLLAAGGCQTTKSSSPTAPTVAGPIPGVTITAPVLIQPAQGFKFKESEQPIQLVIQNATTSGVSSTIAAGVSPATIEQNRQAGCPGLAISSRGQSAGELYGRTRSGAASRLGTITLRRK